MTTMVHPDYLPGDIIHQRGVSFPVSSAIRDICDSWGSHDAPVFERCGKLFVLEVAPPRSQAFPIDEYIARMKERGVRWVTLRMHFNELANDNPFLETEVQEWRQSASAYWAMSIGRSYSNSEIRRILYRSAIDILPLPDTWLSKIKPRKGMVYCTRECINGLIMPPLRHAGAPQGLAEKLFVNPGDMERAFVLGQQLIVVDASDTQAPFEIKRLWLES